MHITFAHPYPAPEWHSTYTGLITTGTKPSKLVLATSTPKVVVVTLTRIIKSVVTGQAPVTKVYRTRYQVPGIY